ncbi:MAG: N-methyl-L-tryptophan oxidase [Anaerolineales bacterium]|nr:N-methyl-L-tryptophan oxidase [Anaerolineales bacterium]
MKTTYDTIVIGLGGLGAAAYYWLSRELGGELLGIEQFEIGHPRGGSQDHSRIIRIAQHQDIYTDLARPAYDAWYSMQAEAGVQVVWITGGLVIEEFGVRDTSVAGTRDLARYTAAMRRRNIPFEALTPAEVHHRWPQFTLQDHEAAVYQAESGFVDAGKALLNHLALGRARGAALRDRCPVLAVRPISDRAVEVVTTHGTFSARSVVLAAGIWTERLLAGAGVRLPFYGTQEQVTYFTTPHTAEFKPERFPIWLFHGRDSYYGFPVYGELATKMGQHLAGPEVTPETRTFEPDPVREARYAEFLRTHIPRAAGPILYTKTCLYHNTPDQEFVISTLPEYPQISVTAAGGQGYKFASVIGQALRDLALHRQSALPIAPFSLNRPAFTDPDFRRLLHH